LAQSNQHEEFDVRYCRHDQTVLCDDRCFYRRILAVIGKKYTLNILRILVRVESARFNTLAKGIGGSPKTLTDRLNELVDLGILNREAYAEIPPRVEYSLNEMGRDLAPVLDAIRNWTLKWWSHQMPPQG
jgi:DNA-binding HxlR family transcriptional regulator